MSSTAAVTLITGTNAGAHVPFTEAWVQGSTTHTYTLVGQILDNGKTNFVGYDAGSAYYLATTSANGAVQTTLANGASFYVTSGSAPTGYIATGVSDGAGGGVVMSSSGRTSAATPAATSSSGAGNTGSGGAMTTAPTSSRSATGSAAPATTTSGAKRVSVFSMGFALSAIAALMLGVVA